MYARLLVEDYEWFPPEDRKNRKSEFADSCRCGSKTCGEGCILEGAAEGASGGTDIPTHSAEQETREANVSEERQQPEAGEDNVLEERQHPEASGLRGAPKALLHKKMVWNIDNKDDDCFFWCIRIAEKLRYLQENWEWVSLLGAAACPGRPPMWAEGCTGGVCHSPAEGVRQRGAAVGNHRIPWEASYVGGGVRQRGVPWPCRGGVPAGGVAVGSRCMPWGCARGVPLLETAACPGRPSM